MARAEDLRKFYADLVECMPITSIRQQMEEDKEIKKLPDLNKCTNSTSVKREITDRILEIFSDDLFSFLLPRRLGITKFHSLLQRTPQDPISPFDPDVGISVLLYSYRFQRAIFVEILKHKLDVENLDSIALYFTDEALSLCYVEEYNIFQKLLLLASITLELTAFCYIQGNGNAIHYASRSFFSAFQHIFKKDFFANGGWKAWKVCVTKDANHYKENQCEVPVIVNGKQMIAVNTMWLKKYDRWIFLRACNQIEPTLINNKSGNQSDSVGDETVYTTDDSEKMPRGISEMKDERLLCILLKDCDLAKRFQSMTNSIILDLIEIITLEIDSAYEDILQIISKDACVEKLMRYCMFPRLVFKAKEGLIKLRNIDILQSTKLILRGNARMAGFCSHLVSQIFEELEKIKSPNQNDSQGNSLGITAENLNRQETNYNIESVEHLSPKKESSSPASQKYKELIDKFLKVIKAHDQPSTSAALQIHQIFSNEAKSEILLTFEPFRKLMNTTVFFSEDRCDDEWILSVMTMFIDNFLNDLKHQPTVDIPRTDDYIANEVFEVPTNPELTGGAPCGETKTAHSSEPSTPDFQNIETEPVCDDTNPELSECAPCDETKTAQSSELAKSNLQNIETEPFCDDTNTEQVENKTKNLLSFNICEQCFHRLKRTLRLMKYYSTTGKFSIPRNKTSGKKRTKKRTHKKQNSNIKRNTHEASVDIEASSTNKASETARIDFPLIDLYSECTSIEVKQTHNSECEINVPKKAVENVETCRNSQVTKHECGVREITFLLDDSSAVVPETQPEGEIEIGDLISFSEISSV